MVRIVKKADVRRAEIVQTARDLFQTKGYANTTMQDVMDTLEIAKGTIYHHFNSKEELFEAVVEEIVAEASAQMQSLFEQAEGNALEKMSALIQAGRVSDGKDNLLENLHNPDNAAMHVRLMAVAVQKQAPLYAAIIRQGCAEGLFQCEAPLECAEFILAAVQFLTDQGIYPWSQADLQRRALAFPALLEAQLRAAPGSFNFLLNEL